MAFRKVDEQLSGVPFEDTGQFGGVPLQRSKSQPYYRFQQGLSFAQPMSRGGSGPHVSPGKPRRADARGGAAGWGAAGGGGGAAIMGGTGDLTLNRAFSSGAADFQPPMRGVEQPFSAFGIDFQAAGQMRDYAGGGASSAIPGAAQDFRGFYSAKPGGGGGVRADRGVPQGPLQQQQIPMGFGQFLSSADQGNPQGFALGGAAGPSMIGAADVQAAGQAPNGVMGGFTPPSPGPGKPGAHIQAQGQNFKIDANAPAFVPKKVNRYKSGPARVGQTSAHLRRRTEENVLFRTSAQARKTAGRGADKKSSSKSGSGAAASASSGKPGGSSAGDKSSGTSAADASGDDTYRVGKAVEICRMRFQYDPPVETCTLTPYYLIRDSEDNTRVKTDTDSILFRWYRGQKCLCASCGKRAFFQSMTDSKLYYCSSRCMRSRWRDVDAAAALAKAPTRSASAPSDLFQKFPGKWEDSWTFVDSKKCYMPSSEDVGRRLRFEAACVDPDLPAEEAKKGAKWRVLYTSPVMRVPAPPRERKMIYYRPAQARRGDAADAKNRSNFRVKCYNALAEIYATGHMYPYCPLWALQWSFRRKSIVREIMKNRAEVICLQEVQENHYKRYFEPEMKKLGYAGVFKRKTRESMSDDPGAVDGCAIFFDTRRFSLTEKHEIEFNQQAKMRTSDRSLLRRMSKGNIALVVVLTDLQASSRQMGGPRQLVVANTHIYWDPEFKDVKLWQTLILCHELQRIMRQRKLPMLLCGDFNSEVQSTVYLLLSAQSVPQHHPILQDSWMQKLVRVTGDLKHGLPLKSAYSLIGEPEFTNYTGHYVGTLDYIWFTEDALDVIGVLEMNKKEELEEFKALPSPLFPSDHLQIMAEFAWR